MQSSPLRGVRVCATLVLFASTAAVASAALKVAPGYRVRTVLDTGPGRIAGGLAFDVSGDAMYCGSGTNILRWQQPFTGSFAPFGTIPPATDIAALAAVGGDVFVARGTSFVFPFPHALGRLSGGAYSNLFALDGLFDLSASDAGSLFLVANPGGAGTQLFQLDPGAAAPAAIVTNGGYSGGSAFRDGDGLYYADQNAGAILRFADTNAWAMPVSDVLPPAGRPQIDPHPQVVVSNVWGGYLAFDAKDRLLATTGFGNELRAYSPWGGGPLEMVAWDDAGGYGIGQVALNLHTREIVLIFTDWSAFRSRVVALRPYWTGGDTDGNHSANVAGYNRRTAAWRIGAPESGGVAGVSWGGRGEQPLIGDFDGDGIGDLATRNTATGHWNIRWSGPVIAIYPPPGFDLPAGSWHVPCAADFDGDGRTDPAVYNKRTGQFTIGNAIIPLQEGAPRTSIAPYPAVGIPGGIPVPGDYDGDGRAEPVVYLPASGQWLVSVGGDAIGSLGQWGWSRALPVPSDYDGDGRTDLATFDPNTCNWYIRRSSDLAPRYVQFGYPGCVAAPADYDGDQKSDVAVYDPRNGMFYAFRTTAGFLQMQLGAGLQIVTP